MTPTPLPGTPPRILLVEDDEINSMVAQALLEALGYDQVHTATDGQQALAHCAAFAPDLVLMDCVMPGMGGLEATRRLRAAGFDRPVIALTAHTAADDVAQCRAAGMDDHLAKPIDTAHLASKLATWLVDARQRQPALN